MNTPFEYHLEYHMRTKQRSFIYEPLYLELLKRKVNKHIKIQLFEISTSVFLAQHKILKDFCNNNSNGLYVLKLSHKIPEDMVFQLC